MHRVYGLVTTKETGEGIPSLEVALFDTDLSRLEPSRLETPPKSGGGKPEVERIGSVLTAADGSFELTFEESDFRHRDREGRPDLVVAVLAPEEADDDEQPAQKAASRVLYVSRTPRLDAGQTEAYAIRVPQAELDRRRIPAGRNAQSEATRHASSVAEIWEFGDALREQLGAQLKERGSRADALRRASREKFGLLRAAPARRRADPLYVARSSQPAELRSAQEKAIEDGLSQLSKSRGGLRLRLGDEELEGLDLEALDNGAELEAAESAVMAIVSERADETDLVRARSLIDACAAPRDMLDAASRPQTPADPEPADQPPAERPGWTAAEAERHLLRLAMDQVASFDVESGPDSLPARPDAAKVQETVDALRLAGGPADATAYHDFHVLQMAFKHVWTEAFDERIRDRVAELYEHTVRIRQDLGLPSPDGDAVTEVNQLRELLNATRGEMRSLGSIGGVPDAVRRLIPQITQEGWNALSLEQQRTLVQIAESRGAVRVQGASERSGDRASRHPEVRVVNESPEDVAMRILAQPEGSIGRAQRLILELDQRLREPFAFDLFAPSSYNFGIMVTYRQRWNPLSYQAGELVTTIPLAPGETRRYSKKQVVSKKRAEKEAEKALVSRAEESSLQLRAESEILRKASTATNFKMTAEGSLSFGVGELSGSTAFAVDQAKESARNKRDFREATLKASEEYRRERLLEIETTSAEELEGTTSGEIGNPNDEIAVTYLFYELQRRYRIGEFIQRVRPVIMVAQDVPAPHEIDEDWLLAHEWVLRRVILDDSFLPALDYLGSGFAGDEFSVEFKRAGWEAQRRLVEKLEATASEQAAMRDALREKLIETALGRDRAAASESTFGEDLGGALVAGAFGMAPASLLFGSEDERDTELQEALRKAAETRLGYVEEALQDAQAKLSRAGDALATATREYTEALERQLNERTAIDQLRVHVKDNVLHYMQAIWDHEPPDQRFFRLYDLKIACPQPDGDCRVRAVKETRAMGAHPGDTRTVVRMEDFCSPTLSEEEEEVDLVQIADLDNPLGYKGNYIIFPLRKACHITTFMMREFVDDHFGVRDPDELGDYSTQELADYIKCAWHRDDVSDDERELLRDVFLQRVGKPRRSSDEIVVPTGHLFVEALPGRHPLLEDFKLRHRREDARSAQAGVRHAELENLRLAARLVAGEREDPEIEKKVVFDGGAGVVVEE